MTYRVSFLALLVTLPLQPQRLQGQVGAKLQSATARLDEEFSHIVGLRELRDGRVLVTDARDRRLLVADFARNAVAQIGREGSGPDEYTQVSVLTSLGPDSTLMPDPASHRWLIIGHDRIALTIPSDHPGIKASGGGLRGTDEHGHGLVVTPPPIRGPNQRLGKADSIALVLVTLTSGATDTVTRLQTAPLTVWTERDNSGKVTRAGLRYPPFSVGEEPFLFPDGWLAIARLDPYRVDWRRPEGDWIHGEPLPFVEHQMDARERAAYLARLSTTFGRAPAVPPDESWPASIPPFQPSPAVAAPDGSLFILRTPTATHPGHRYDRVNRHGRLMGWLELPAAEHLVGIGVYGAYVIATDETGIQHLKRHPWP